MFEIIDKKKTFGKLSNVSKFKHEFELSFLINAYKP